MAAHTYQPGFLWPTWLFRGRFSEFQLVSQTQNWHPEYHKYTWMFGEQIKQDRKIGIILELKWNRSKSTALVAWRLRVNLSSHERGARKPPSYAGPPIIIHTKKHMVDTGWFLHPSLTYVFTWSCLHRPSCWEYFSCSVFLSYQKWMKTRAFVIHSQGRSLYPPISFSSSFWQQNRDFERKPRRREGKRGSSVV